MTRLHEVASVFRSKNADPFLTTVDVFFPTDEAYDKALFDCPHTDAIAERYGIPREVVYGTYFVDPIRAFKVTFYKYVNGRYVGQGDPECGDMFGAQQHVPLLDIELG